MDYDLIPSSNFTVAENYTPEIEPDTRRIVARVTVDPASDYPDLSQIAFVRLTFIILFVTASFICIFGNLLVIVTVYRNKSMHSPVNYYIVNLGICDFMVGAAVLPTKLYELLAEARANFLNAGLCTFVRFAETVFVFASIYTLVAICIERYYAVVYPMHSRMHMSRSRTGRVLATVWILPVLLATPTLYPANAVSVELSSKYGTITRKYCADRFSDSFRQAYFLTLFVFMYAVPLLIIGATCFAITRAMMQKIPAQTAGDSRTMILEKGRRKVAKMVLVLVVAYVICWTPYFVVSMVTQKAEWNYFRRRDFYFTMLCINLMGFLNSCVNPIVYSSMSSRFRQGFLGILSSLVACSRRSSSGSSSTSSIKLTTMKLRVETAMAVKHECNPEEGDEQDCSMLTSASSRRKSSPGPVKQRSSTHSSVRSLPGENSPQDTGNILRANVSMSRASRNRERKLGSQTKLASRTLECTKSSPYKDKSTIETRGSNYRMIMKQNAFQATEV